MTDTTKWKTVTIRKADYELLVELKTQSGASIPALIHEAVHRLFEQRHTL